MARRLPQKHGKGFEGTQGDELEFHHAGDAQGQLFEELMRFGGRGAVHEEDDPVCLVLEEPLIDLAGQMKANRCAHLKRQDGADRVGRPLGRDVANREDFSRWNCYRGERGKIATSAPRLICSVIVFFLLLV